MASAGGWTFRDTGRAHSRLLMGGAQIIEDLHQLQDDQDADDMLRVLHDADVSKASEGIRRPKGGDMNSWDLAVFPAPCVAAFTGPLASDSMRQSQICAANRTVSSEIDEMRDSTYTSHTEWSWLICWPIWQMGLKNQPRTAFTCFFPICKRSWHVMTALIWKHDVQSLCRMHFKQLQRWKDFISGAARRSIMQHYKLLHLISQQKSSLRQKQPPSPTCESTAQISSGIHRQCSREALPAPTWQRPQRLDFLVLCQGDGAQLQVTWLPHRQLQSEYSYDVICCNTCNIFPGQAAFKCFQPKAWWLKFMSLSGWSWRKCSDFSK